MKRATLFSAIAIAAAMSAPVAMAQETPVLDRASFQLKLAIPDTQTDVRADGTTGSGTEVDFENDLGIDNDSNVATIGGTFRPWDNHEFSLTYYTLDNDATRRISRNISFDGQNYATNSTIKTEYSLDTFDMSYTWWGMNEDSWALGPRVGLVWYSLDLGLSATLDANGVPVAGGVGRAEISANVPAPTIGGGWRWRPADHWRVKVDGGYFQANISDFDGAVTYVSAGVEWIPWENWGFTGTYTRSNIDVSGTDTDFTGDLDFTQANFSLGVIYRF